MKRIRIIPDDNPTVNEVRAELRSALADWRWYRRNRPDWTDLISESRGAVRACVTILRASVTVRLEDVA